MEQTIDLAQLFTRTNKVRHITDNRIARMIMKRDGGKIIQYYFVSSSAVTYEPDSLVLRALEWNASEQSFVELYYAEFFGAQEGCQFSFLQLGWAYAYTYTLDSVNTITVFDPNHPETVLASFAFDADDFAKIQEWQDKKDQFIARQRRTIATRSTGSSGAGFSSRADNFTLRIALNPRRPLAKVQHRGI